MPADRLLIETDSPYLAPVPHRGKPNRPALVPLVGACLAELRGVPVANLCSTTAAASRSAFPGTALGSPARDGEPTHGQEPEHL